MSTKYTESWVAASATTSGGGSGTKTGQHVCSLDIPSDYIGQTVTFQITDSRGVGNAGNTSNYLITSTKIKTDATGSSYVDCSSGDSINLTGATIIYFQLNTSFKYSHVSGGSNTQTHSARFYFTVIFPWGVVVAEEETITAAKVIEAATAAGVTLSTTPTRGANIVKTQWQQIANAVNVSLDATKP